MKQEQFLEVLDRDEAERRFRAALDLAPLGAEEVPLDRARGRVLAEDVHSGIDVPGFDRANMDGYAVRAADTFGATEERPRRLRLTGETLATGVAPRLAVLPGAASAIATGGMVPRGADAVVLVEATDEEEDGTLLVRRAVTPGTAISFAGTDVARGELLLFSGDLLTSRETALLAAIGRSRVQVRRRPRVAILSTGDEIVAPGTALGAGEIHDSNGQALFDAVAEQGGEPCHLGIVPDDEAQLLAALGDALDRRRAAPFDMVLLSGGTSKGPGDVAYRALRALGPPGVLVHGVALKPGKPLCLAAAGRIPVAVLPGFPTSALFTFHEFLAPVIRLLAGRADDPAMHREATLPLRVASERGRTEYLLVNLLEGPHGAAAWPLGKGSGSVSTFSKADGFVVIPANREILDEGSTVQVTLLGRGLRARDLVFAGSHCVGLDLLARELRRRGVTATLLAIGSEAGLAAARSGQCDVAGIHLLDAATERYNAPFLDDTLELHRGYGRMQGLVYRRGDPRFAGREPRQAVTAAAGDVVMVNRNRGSGTRLLIDRLLGAARPDGYLNEARTHNAVAAAVAAGRADFGVAIATVAADYGLGFTPLRREEYDFVVPKARRERPAVRAFLAVLADPAVRAALAARGFLLGEEADGG